MTGRKSESERTLGSGGRDPKAPVRGPEAPVTSKAPRLRHETATANERGEPPIGPKRVPPSPAREEDQEDVTDLNCLFQPQQGSIVIGRGSVYESERTRRYETAFGDVAHGRDHLASLVAVSASGQFSALKRQLHHIPAGQAESGAIRLNCKLRFAG